MSAQWITRGHPVYLKYENFRRRDMEIFENTLRRSGMTVEYRELDIKISALKPQVQ